MAEVVVQRRIAAPAQRVWQILSEFGGLAAWNPGIESCSVEGEGIGAVRTIGMAGGFSLQERLEAHDPEAHHYAYSIVGEPPLPFGDYLSNVRVEPEGEGACRVDWRGRFEPKGDEATAAKIITSIYSGGLAALGKHLGVSVEEVD